MLDARTRESGILHPTPAVGARVIKPARQLNQHVQAHEQSESIGTALIINDGIIHDEGTAPRQRRIRLSDQLLFLIQIPVVQDMAHHQDVRAGQVIGEKVAGMELQASDKS